MDDENQAGVRVDRWIWAARFFKTRSLATAATNAGHVDVNGEGAKPAKPVRPGDTVRVRAGRTTWVVVVRSLSEKRGSARIARGLYEETEESRAERERQAELRRMAPPLGTELSGRPTKRDQRRIERLRRSRGG